MLRKSKSKRTVNHNLQLASTTATAAGMVNVASVIAFFAFSSNVTGHMAIFAEEIVKGHWHQVSIVFAWLFAFFFGAFLSNFILISFNHFNGYLTHSIPVALEIIVLGVIGFYGDKYYMETLRETEFLVMGLLFAMGLQNSLVATISGGAVKTTHVTGLFTDLGMEVSMYLNPKFRTDKQLLDKLNLHLVVAGFYFGGGVLGGFLFLQYGFKVFYAVCLVLFIVLLFDYYVLAKYKFLRKSDKYYKKLILLKKLEKSTKDNEELVDEIIKRKNP